MKEKIFKYQIELDSINKNIIDTIELCSADFTSVSNELKKLFISVESNNYKIELSELVNNLQFADSFKQRLTHILDINNLITSSFSIILVNFYQLQLVVFDLINTNKKCAQIVGNLSNLISNQSSNSILINFANYNLIINKLNESLAKYEYLIDILSIEQSLINLTEKEKTQITKHYAMDCERYIFEWLINNNNISFNNLKLDYEKFISNSNNIEEIELF